ncbi:hypothetical protein [Salinicola socius]|uniref:DNA gyrase subunit B n=1 Tax=Salinicola socius TaxID=404433 RepID=A0A1Q8SWX3_9GAMM|nr:hypothetical protein [Salinicola socius]OLO05939.1 hypothetical protein BTW07_00055 [Salinicola socius]
MSSAISSGRHRLLWLAVGFVGLLWPLVVHFLLPHYGAWPLLIALAAIAWWRLPAGQRRWGWVLLPLTLVLMATDSAELGLRLWPVVVNLALLLVFAHGLRHPPTLIERFARRQEPDLPPHAVRYTRRVTQAWCVFFVLNGSVALATAIHADLDVWAWYNGGIVYGLMLAMFLGEWCIRQRVKRRAEEHRDGALQGGHHEEKARHDVS